MKAKTRSWVIATLSIIAVIVICWINYPRDRGIKPVSEQEEFAAAQSLLARKLSGPRYFSVPASAMAEDRGPWISATDAISQVPKIMGERKLGPESMREIGRLIDQVVEPNPSRMVGGERINLLRLNLSLDAINDH